MQTKPLHITYKPKTQTPNLENVRTCQGRLHPSLDQRDNDAETAGLGGVVDRHVAEVVAILQGDSRFNQGLQMDHKIHNFETIIHMGPGP